MGNSKVAINTMMTLWVVICILGFSVNVAANAEPDGATTAGSSAGQEATQHVVQFIRDRDYACTQCHKDEQDRLQGAHGDVIHASTNRAVTCTDCHGKVGQHHRDGAPEVMKFAPAQTVAGAEKPAADPQWVMAQNQTCVECHTPQVMREASWTHDVHATTLSCASCHTVHPVADPMAGISRKSKIKLCVDCHSDQQKTNRR
ncbi:cytochrome c nitrite reductase pentaheme subunit [Photobacterium atrarenae]|uniref:Cytochrome c nitrite reductase pentaheme subunit n=1 Tax=Photobacterium atrarenae TaxID=865757 RepID=A0ABY5GBY3_9GAMM|nr:cytochrome c nitrite reductase pentaheme subunit [Photobacterium atrarenae]UTV26700.1 cytochrome c nitrite reductase pentaheme subunit [Photobacterium atrarenae]